MNKTLSPPPQTLQNAAEETLAKTPAIERPNPSADELLHQLQIHQIELEMQNEALRQAQVALEESHDRYLDLYEFAPIGYLTLTHGGEIAEANLTATTLLGEERKHLIHRRFAALVAAKDIDHWHLHFLHMLRHNGQQSCEIALLRPDGSAFDAHLDVLRIVGADNAPMLHITLTDITDSKRTEEALRIAAITFETQEGMIVTDANAVILRVNRAFTRLTGYSAEEAIGRTPALLNSGHHPPAFYQQMWQTLEEKGYWQGEIWNQCKDGRVYTEWLTISAVTAPDGSTTHYVGAFSDITANKEAEAKIHRLAYYDPLTNLPNRRLLSDRLSQSMSSSNRSGHYGALILLDLDHFKNLNDTRGHDTGDQLLTETAQRLQLNRRKGDTVARLGGDEFVVVLEGLNTDPQVAAIQASRVSEKISKILARPYHLVGGEFYSSASLGITLFHNHEKPVETLFKQADLALYKAKNAGRNTLCFFDPAMQIDLEERNALETDLRRAVELGQLQLYYQPQIEDTGRVIGVEALLRWVHPKRGLVMPGNFIPLAEETGLILSLGRWVLEAACTQIKAWSFTTTTCKLQIAVNVSNRQFRQPEFIAQVTQILKQTGADPANLKIELTESTVFDDVDDTLEKMHLLKSLGIRFSLDDFGTGYSSLSYLTRLPLDQLKIDQSFVSNLPDHHDSTIITQTIITMAQSLGLNVIAEGVETEVQWEFLKRHHCRIFQGFFFSQPLPIVAFEAFVQQSEQ